MQKLDRSLWLLNPARNTAFICWMLALTDASAQGKKENAGALIAAPIHFAGAPVSISANDNRIPAGILRGGTLTVTLELVAGTFTPEAADGPSIPALAFAEVGHAAQIPGPLIRAPRGTRITVRIHNPFSDSSLSVFGLNSFGGSRDDAVEILGGATREISFVASRAGNFYYWGTTGKRTLDERLWFESQLSGAIVIDDGPQRAGDRVFVIGVWDRPGDSTITVPQTPQVVMTINGKSWPYTERFSFTQGDSVSWRWINTSVDSHPMHLHGFYFHIDRRGDGSAERKISSGERPFVVTDLILPGHTMSMSWVAARPGNWLFHCHFAFHVSGALKLPASDSANHHESSSIVTNASHQMAGLVLGLKVAPSTQAKRVQATTLQPRNIRLVAQTAPARYGRLAGMGYVVQQGNASPALDSIQIPGPVLVLEKNAPVRITVVNHLPFETAVHWHGIELESSSDGVPNWSGFEGRVMPPIAPRDSFVAEFTPPRAGTFMYHTHSNEQLQMGSGLYGALIVASADHPFNPDVDKLIVVGGAGPSDSLPQFDFATPGRVNGSDSPPPIELKVGRTYRFRLININPDWRVVFSLLSTTGMMSWRPVAKDGADIPREMRRLAPAYLLTGPGETADFEFTPRRRGDLRFEVKTLLPGWIIPITIRVAE